MAGPINCKRQIRVRDNGLCRYCGAEGTQHDHVHPRSRGGTSHLWNVVLCCKACNQAKGSKTVADWRPDLAYLVDLIRVQSAPFYSNGKLFQIEVAETFR